MVFALDVDVFRESVDSLSVLQELEQVPHSEAHSACVAQRARGRREGLEQSALGALLRVVGGFTPVGIGSNGMQQRRYR